MTFGSRRDPSLLVLMQWFINEQVEEEKNAKLIVDQLKLAGDSGSALLILDRELGARSPEADEGDARLERTGTRVWANGSLERTQKTPQAVLRP